MNLDLGSVSVCPSLKVPEIPRFAAKIFKARYAEFLIDVTPFQFFHIRFENIPKPFDLQYSRYKKNPVSVSTLITFKDPH